MELFWKDLFFYPLSWQQPRGWSSHLYYHEVGSLQDAGEASPVLRISVVWFQVFSLPQVFHCLPVLKHFRLWKPVYHRSSTCRLHWQTVSTCPPARHSLQKLLFHFPVLRSLHPAQHILRSALSISAESPR